MAGRALPCAPAFRYRKSPYSHNWRHSVKCNFPDSRFAVRPCPPRPRGRFCPKPELSAERCALRCGNRRNAGSCLRLRCRQALRQGSRVPLLSFVCRREYPLLFWRIYSIFYSDRLCRKRYRYPFSICAPSGKAKQAPTRRAGYPCRCNGYAGRRTRDRRATSCLLRRNSGTSNSPLRCDRLKTRRSFHTLQRNRNHGR